LFDDDDDRGTNNRPLGIGGGTATLLFVDDCCCCCCSCKSFIISILFVDLQQQQKNQTASNAFQSHYVTSELERTRFAAKVFCCGECTLRTSQQNFEKNDAKIFFKNKFHQTMTDIHTSTTSTMNNINIKDDDVCVSYPILESNNKNCTVNCKPTQVEIAVPKLFVSSSSSSLSTSLFRVAVPIKFEVGESRVERTYSDFEWLREQLIFEAQGSIVPRLPTRSLNDVEAGFVDNNSIVSSSSSSSSSSATKSVDQLSNDMGVWLQEVMVSSHLSSNATLQAFMTQHTTKVRLLARPSSSTSTQQQYLQQQDVKSSLFDMCRVFFWRLKQRMYSKTAAADSVDDVGARRADGRRRGRCAMARQHGGTTRSQRAVAAESHDERDASSYGANRFAASNRRRIAQRQRAVGE
jgi:hypothetical protein